MEFVQQAALVMALVLLAFTFLLKSSRRRKSAIADDDDDGVFPPCPPGTAWPVLGHLPFLSTGCPHHTLTQLARGCLGPIIGLHLGSKLAVVVCDSHLTKELLHTHDKLLSNRPRFLFADSLMYGYNSSLVLSTYNARWVMLRKLSTSELFTAKRLQFLQHLRYQEVSTLLHTLLQASLGGTQAVQLEKLFSLMLCNTMSRLLHSEPLALDIGGSHALPALIKAMEKEGTPTISDFLPWLKLIDLPRKYAMKRVHDRVDKIVETMVSRRRQLMKSTQADELPQDFLQVLLSREANNQQQPIDQDDELLTTKEIKSIITDVLSAGVLTTSLTLEWAMAELLRNPHCLQTIRDEIDVVMGEGSEEFVRDEDIQKLPYLEKVVKEVLRLHPSAPLYPRCNSEAVKVGGYTLPANTIVIINAWAMGRDPDVWEKAEEFFPERFDGNDMDIKGQHFELLPFGSGRRVCPGIRLALSVLHVTLANLVRTFDWQLPNGQTHMDIDMSEQRGPSSMRLTPLLAIPKPRFTADRNKIAKSTALFL